MSNSNTIITSTTMRPKSPFNYMKIHSYGSISSNNPIKDVPTSNTSFTTTSTQKKSSVLLSHGIGSSHHFSSAFSATAVSRVPQDEVEDYQFGFIPNDIFQQLTDTEHYQKRLEAIEKLCVIVQHFQYQPYKVKAYLPPILQLFIGLFDDQNFKVSRMSVDVFFQFAQKLGNDFKPLALDALIPKMRWGDPKLISRQISSLIFARTISILSPQEVLARILRDIRGYSWNIKEEVINFVIYCLLFKPKEHYDFRQIVNILLDSIQDIRLRVKFVSIEAIAVIHHTIGRNALEELLSPIRTTEEETYQLICERLQQTQLPKISTLNEGVVEHALLQKLRNTPRRMVGLTIDSQNQEEEPSKPVSKVTAPVAPVQNTRKSIMKQPPTQQMTQQNLRISTTADEDIEDETEGSYNIRSSISPVYNDSDDTHSVISQFSQVSFSSAQTDISTRLSALKRRQRSALSSMGSFDTVPSTSSGALTPSNISVHSLPTGRVTHSDEEEDVPQSPKSIKPIFQVQKRKPTKSAPPTQNIPKETSSSSVVAHKNVIELNAKPLEEIPSEQLLPSENPTSELATAVNDLNSSNWQSQFNSLTSIRRLCIFNSDLIIPKLHTIVGSVLGFVNNLRSSLSKNAMICLTDMFEHIGKYMDSEIDSVVPVLLKKTGEANRFINDQAIKAIQTMILHTSEERCLSSLISFADNKSASIRGDAAMLINQCVKKMKSRIFKCKDFGKFMLVALQFLNDGSFEARKFGQRIVYHLYEYATRGTEQPSDSNFDRIVKKFLNEKEFKQFKDAIEKRKQQKEVSSSLTTKISNPRMQQFQTLIQNKRNTSPPKKQNLELNLYISTENEPVPPKPKTHSGNSNLLEFSRTEIPEFVDLLRLLQSADWQERVTGVSRVVDVVEENLNELQDRDMLDLFDALLPRLSDSNSKVNSLAFTTLNKIIPLLSESLKPFANRIVEIIANSLGSTNPQIRTSCAQAFDTLLRCVDSCTLLPHLVTTINATNTRTKAIIMEKLRPVVQNAYLKKPSVVIRHVLPMCCKLIKESKTNVKAANISILKTLYFLMKEDLFEYCSTMSECSISAEEMQRIRDYVT